MKPTDDLIRDYRDALRFILGMAEDTGLPGERVMETHEVFLTWVLDGDEGIDQLAHATIAECRALIDARRRRGQS